MQAAVAHFVDLAVCYQAQGAEVSDPVAKKLIGGVANTVLRHLRLLEVDHRRVVALSIFGDLEDIYRTMGGNPFPKGSSFGWTPGIREELGALMPASIPDPERDAKARPFIERATLAHGEVRAQFDSVRTVAAGEEDLEARIQRLGRSLVRAGSEHPAPTPTAADPDGDVREMLKKALQDYASSVLRPYTDDELDELVPFKVKETSASKAKASLKSFKRRKTAQTPVRGEGGETMFAEQALAILLGTSRETIHNWRKWASSGMKVTKDGEVVVKHATLRFNPPTAFGMHASAIARVKYLVDALKPFDNNSTRSRTEAQLRRVRAAVEDAERMDDDEAKAELSEGEGSSPRGGQGSRPALPWPLRWSRDRD